jgi:uncharacterized RDD family membrane protein YckC
MSELSITTTQNVNINFKTASVGDRVLAYILDLLIWIAYFIALSVLFDVTGFENYLGTMDRWSQAAIYILFYLPVFLYTIAFESFIMEGQTPGKRIMKIKVIKIDGYQAAFGDYLIRWLFSLIEVNFPFTLIGFISLIATKKTQRLGDMASGTAVISLKNDITINHTILKEIADAYVPVYPLVIKLSDNDVRIIKETYETSLKVTDFEMMLKLQRKVEDVTGIKSVSANATAFIDTILNDYNFYTQRM